MFCDSNSLDLPFLFDESIKDTFTGIRRYRHYAMHGYAFQIDWDRIKNSILNIESVYQHFKNNLENFLNIINKEGA